ncbi:uncharacterized protein LOC101240293 isoform X1 [Hydra vulgaris]|uniref:uncharacterized protein LOC101240293 isoform X1 n=1 Tax=Hydra vulgaris TaxID=6087 RepID=UPI001F5FA848|nr:uncharacterized protein LOC101240293 [Hydra vulgaris]
MSNSGETIPLVSTKVKNSATFISVDIDPLNPFNEDYKERENFWEQVIECFDRESKINPEITWIKVETRLRLELLKKRYNDPDIPDSEKSDVLVVLMTAVYERFKNYVTEHNQLEMLDSFVSQLSDFADILLQEDFNGFSIFPLTNPDPEIYDANPKTHKSLYAGLLKINNSNKSETTILHLAAENGLCEIAQKYLMLYPNSVCRKDYPEDGTRRRMAVEIALDKKNDKLCSLLMKSMLNERVRDLFANESLSTPGQYSLGDLIMSGSMKETVLAVLDSCINPDFPYIIRDEQQKKKEEEAWSKMPQLPLRFNFFFRILDGDSEGRPAKIFKNSNDQGLINPDFKHLTKSPLYIIANYANFADKLDPIRHPLVRQLVRQKWNNYGSTSIMMKFAVYLLFLLFMSFAFILHASSINPFDNISKLDKFRNVSQVIVALLTIVYLFSAISEFCKDPFVYMKSYYYMVHSIGLLLVIVLIPLHFYTDPSVTRAVGSVAYFINFICVFQYFLTSESYGIYTKTFAMIIYTDIKKFSVVFCVVLFAFSGSIFLAISASTAFDVNNTRTYWSVLLKGMRAISEGKEFADDYSGYHILLLFLILSSMFAIIVIMANILIGQLSFRFEMAQQDATIQLDIDKAKMITHIERSWFKTHNKRIKYYKDGIFVSRIDMFNDLLQDWDLLQSEGDDKTKSVIQNMMEKRILKKKN